MATLNASDLTVGGIEFYFAPTIAKDPVATVGMDDVPLKIGNITVGELTPNITYVEHYISKKGNRVKDAEEAVTKGMTISITFDEINATNLSRFVLGSALDSPITQSIMLAEEAIEGRAVVDFQTNVGNSVRFIIPKCNMKPDGGLPLRTEDWQTGNFMIEVLSHDTYRVGGSPASALAPFGYIDRAPTQTIASYF